MATILLLAMMQFASLQMMSAVTVTSSFYAPAQTTGYYEFIPDGFAVTVQNPPHWLDVSEGKQYIWIAYRKSPAMHISVGGHILTFVPVDPFWRDALKGLDGFDRVEERIIRLKEEKDAITIKFLMRE